MPFKIKIQVLGPLSGGMPIFKRGIQVDFSVTLYTVAAFVNITIDGDHFDEASVSGLYFG